MAKKSVLICGQAGQGIQSVGYILAKSLLRAGYNVFAWQDFQSRIRGGESSFRLVYSDERIDSLPLKYDFIVSLDKTNTAVYRRLLSEKGILIAEEVTGANSIAVPFSAIAVETGGNPVYTNSAAVGAVAGMIPLAFDFISAILKEEFSSKGADVVSKNEAVARRAYQVTSKGGGVITESSVQRSAAGRMLIAGNEAVALGAIAGGCRFMAAYPMTPSTGVITYLASTSKTTGVLTEQAEDEISAINMALGASYAGARAMTATSGGGFCLMVEGLALAGMTELPLVLVLGQRPGPATGLPTRTEQGELNFAISAGHGEFPRFVFAPCDAVSAFKLTAKAFELSQKYRAPALVLTDQYIADSYWTANMSDFAGSNAMSGGYFADPAKYGDNFKTFAFTEGGVSPALKPGSGLLVLVDSDEHDEYGHITEDTDLRKLMVEKRWKKFDKMKADVSGAEYAGPAGADVLLVSWGSNCRIVSEAAAILRDKKINAASVGFTELWPLKVPEQLKGSGKKIIVVENNFTGQFAGMLAASGVNVAGKILKYNGLPFSSEEVVSEAGRIL
jgi:2-oxoglutarate ferredoxin oxidoreductase subunit alpha